VRRGGDARRAVLVYHPIEIRPFQPIDYRREYGLQSKFIFGFHQRDDAHIFSPMMLQAFHRIASPQNHFMILGGSERHRQLAADLGLTNITFLPHSANPDVLYSFLSTLNVFAHGRSDGEINSTAIAEALAFGLPVVTHYTDTYNGQVEGVGDAGFAAHTVDEYTDFLKRLESNPALYKDYSERARHRFKDNFDLHTQVAKMRALYHEVVANPFPNPWRRSFLAARQRVFPRAPSWMLRRAVLRLRDWVVHFKPR
jgi:glycosyltransferase involved in cell wall biosynthesis